MWLYGKKFISQLHSSEFNPRLLHFEQVFTIIVLARPIMWEFSAEQLIDLR